MSLSRTSMFGSTTDDIARAAAYIDKIISSLEDARTTAQKLRHLIGRPEEPSPSPRLLMGRTNPVVLKIDARGRLLEDSDTSRRRTEPFKAVFSSRTEKTSPEMEGPASVGSAGAEERPGSPIPPLMRRPLISERALGPEAGKTPVPSRSELHAAPQVGGPGWFPEIRTITNRRDALKTVRENGQMIVFLSKELKDDEEVLLEAGGNYDMAFLSASDRLKNDRTFILRFAQRNGLVLQWVGPVFQDDKEIVVAALQQNRRAYWYVSQGLQHDPDVLRAAGR